MKPRPAAYLVRYGGGSETYLTRDPEYVEDCLRRFPGLYSSTELFALDEIERALREGGHGSAADSLRSET